MEKIIPIVKADGSVEPFKISKLETSLRRAKVPKKEIEQVVTEIMSHITEGITTDDIYRKVYSHLQKVERASAARYSLRRALFDLGPSGFPFEDFVAEIFRAKGYRTRTGVFLKGRCSNHEIDVLAEKRMERIGAELKFHNSPGVKTDLKIALYVHARFEDIKQHAQSTTGAVEITRPLLITNTKFTRNAIDYASCAGLDLIGWSYPRKENLEKLILETGLHPLTCLTTLSTQEKRRFLEHKIVLCKTLQDNPDIMLRQGIKQTKVDSVLKEGALLCVPGSAV